VVLLLFNSNGRQSLYLNLSVFFQTCWKFRKRKGGLNFFKIGGFYLKRRRKELKNIFSKELNFKPFCAFYLIEKAKKTDNIFNPGVTNRADEGK